MSVWISVDDRLPVCNKEHGESNYVIFTESDKDHPHVGWYNERLAVRKIITSGSHNDPVDNVTHWMPLLARPVTKP